MTDSIPLETLPGVKYFKWDRSKITFTDPFKISTAGQTSPRTTDDLETESVSLSMDAETFGGKSDISITTPIMEPAANVVDIGTEIEFGTSAIDLYP